MKDDPARADEGEEYEDDLEEATAPGLAVTMLAGGAIGYAAGGPGGGLAGATTPLLALILQKTVNAIYRDRSHRVETMFETAAETAGLSHEEMAERASESEQTRFLTEKAIQAAGDTIWPEAVRAIGRAYAAGLLAKDKPMMDIRQRVLGIMKDLDELHVRLLELLVRYEPEAGHDGLVAIPQRFPSHGNIFMGGDRPDNPKVWAIGRRKWTTHAICATRSDLEPVLPSLLGELQQSGLAQENDTAPEAIKRLSSDFVKQVNKQGQMQRRDQSKAITIRESTIRVPEPSWSPTELGEKILGFYAEAGAEDSQDPGEGSDAP